jgi:uncharacterized protein YdeI (YjbR/CyaY-like superfamily)
VLRVDSLSVALFVYTKAMETYKELPAFAFTEDILWEKWLDENSEKYPKGVWLKFAKKGSKMNTHSYIEARDTAICFGWIDGLINKFDEDYYTVRFTPRRPKGLWSKVNVAVVEGLIASGRMRPAGLVEVEAAKADGRWDRAYDSSATITVPEDLQEFLLGNTEAKTFFQTLKAAERYPFLYRLQTASDKARPAVICLMLQKGEKFS